MNECYFVGVKYLDYVSKRTNQNVKGYSLNFVESIKDVVGYSAFNVFVNCDVYDSQFKDVPLNSKVNLVYDRYRNVCGCSII